MCLQPTAKTKTATRRHCRWVYDAATTLRLIENGVPAPLVVTTERGEWAYLVFLEADGTWTMAHVASDTGDGEAYTVDPEHGTCTCPHYLRRGECKKHAPALRAALAWLGKAVRA